MKKIKIFNKNEIWQGQSEARESELYKYRVPPKNLHLRSVPYSFTVALDLFGLIIWHDKFL